jgi:hypothetical protein
MKVNPQNLSPNELFQHLFAVVSSSRFLNKQGLGNEVPFFICPFKPEQAVEMAKMQDQLTKRLTEAGIQILAINLYDLTLQRLEQEGDLDWLIENETRLSKQKLLEELQGILDVQSVLIPAIAQAINAQPYDVLFLTGIGEVFPYIRSHNVLNNLQSTAKEKPTLMFFPGDYIHTLETGASLELFGRLHDDKYYRAFNIFHYEV